MEACLPVKMIEMHFSEVIVPFSGEDPSYLLCKGVTLNFPYSKVAFTSWEGIKGMLEGQWCKNGSFYFIGIWEILNVYMTITKFRVDSDG